MVREDSSHNGTGNDDTRDNASPDTPSGASGTPTSQLTIDGASILRSIDRDLAFYRQRLFTSYFFLLVVLVLAVVVKQTHTVTFALPGPETALFLAFYVVIWFVSFALRRSYVKRSSYLRTRRSRLVSESTGEDPYLAPGGGEEGLGWFAWGPSAILLVVVTVFAVVGIVLTLVGR